MTLDEAKILATAVINIGSEIKDGAEHIKMSQITSENKLFELIDNL